VIGFDEACRRIAELAPARRTEPVALAEAHGRRLARPVAARHCAPAVPVSAMDGYAVRESDLVAGRLSLRITGRSFAGEAAPAAALQPGCCMRIFTGAPAPPGADRVVLQEEVEADGDTVRLRAPPVGGRHIRPAGSDFRAGEVLLEAGARLTPQAMVAAAAADLAQVEVFAEPSVAILSTGDELVEPGFAQARPGAIPESVSFGVAGLVRAWGGRVDTRVRLHDELARLEQAAREALARSDIVVVTGGASVGERDFARAMFGAASLELVFAKVAMKPGKPVWVGRAAGRLVVGLPGNPAAAMTTARLFLAPLIAAASGGEAEAAWAWRPAPLAGGLDACATRDLFLRARTTPEGVTPLSTQDSSSQKSLAAADLLIRRRPGAGALCAGGTVETLAF
jgi:molybdopterin molybdotransferase